MIRHSTALVSALLISVAGCGGYDGITGSTGGGGGGGGGGGSGGFVFNAKTNSVAWKSGGFVGVTAANGVDVIVSGTQHTDTMDITIDLHLASFRGARTYNLGDAAAGSYAVVSLARLPAGSGSIYYSTAAAATGSVIVSSYNNHTGDMVASFSFHTTPSVPPGGSFPDSLAVTEGHAAGRITQ